MTDVAIFNTAVSLAATSAAGAGGSIYLAVTDAVQGQIITGIVTVVVAGVSAYFAYRAKVISKETHAAVNSRMDEFKKTFESAFVAQGVVKEKAEEAVRQNAAALANAAGYAAGYAAGVQEQKEKGGVNSP